MNSPVPSTRHHLRLSPQRQITLLLVGTGALLAAFFRVPDALSHQGIGVDNLTDSFRSGVVGLWRSGGREFPGELASTVEFWFRFHLVKASVAALLLGAVVALGVALWRQSRRPADERPRRLLLVPSAVLVALLAPFALVALVANVQGTIAPFASLLPHLTGGRADGELAATLTEIRQELAGHPAGPHSPALSAMISDLAVYHAAVAVMAALLAVALIGVGVALWRQHRVTPGNRSKRGLKAGMTASAFMACAVLVVALANTSTATHSPEALAGLFNGSW
ncbi:tat (twin-arginine translocation) pathway signal sequence [Streptomyces sp. TRM66268-LWL]|uniref:Tat (Twin-arginine translocation) pathway signal sequence n=1 Tax=Streptomyces polyasparticus TaxID=2767826 RepID=A0ABR7SK03_9ACTN|nr:tat (twin-arginine translocation) pathway signal sequence [Streptomyces polyasparticus]MBC9715816.1 tat (twin-arginine translocation) pathway signal sequence [Streptomyces polyasparticus]